MLLKTIFLLIILWFILVAVGNMIRAIRTDSLNARRARAFEPPPEPRREWTPPSPRASPGPERQQQPRATTYGPYRYGEPVKRRPSRPEDVEDARFRDM